MRVFRIATRSFPKLSPIKIFEWHVVSPLILSLVLSGVHSRGGGVEGGGTGLFSTSRSWCRQFLL